MNIGSIKTAVGVLGLLACAGWGEWITTPHPAPGPVHVVYWEKWTDFEGEAMRVVVEEFNRTQDKIHVDLLTVSGIRDKTLLAVAGGNPPDVAGLYGPNVAQYADDKAVIPLDDYCKKAGITADQYVPVYFDIGFYRNHIYSLPTTPASTALHFNKKMLRDAGLPETAPVTIEEMDAVAAKIFKKGADGSIEVSGFLPAEPGWWNWSWGYNFGGRLWDGSTKITANSAENIRAFKWIRSYSEKFGWNELQSFRSGFGNFSSPQNAFLSSKVALELQGVWMYNFITKFSPQLEWSAAPFPYPADRPDLRGQCIADEDVLMIPRGAKHPDEAFEFIKFVQSQKGMELLCLGQRKHSPLIKVSADFYAKHPNPFIKLFNDLPRGQHVYCQPKMGIWPEYEDEMKNAFEEVSLMKKSPQEALDAVQARIQPKLDEYLKHMKLRELSGDAP